MPRALTTAIAALLVLLCVAGPAVAGTVEVHADYEDNGVIDGRHSSADLRAALAAAEGDAQYAGLADAIVDALENRLLGRVDAVPGGGDGAAERGLGLLPRPRAVEDGGGPPWPLLGLAAMGGLLVMTGAGSTVYRRATRRR